MFIDIISFLTCWLGSTISTVLLRTPSKKQLSRMNTLLYNNTPQRMESLQAELLGQARLVSRLCLKSVGIPRFIASSHQASWLLKELLILTNVKTLKWKWAKKRVNDVSMISCHHYQVSNTLDWIHRVIETSFTHYIAHFHSKALYETFYYHKC